MDLNWLIWVILAVMAYACLCYVIKTRKWLPNVFDFMGPCLLIKTKHTGIFDKLSRPKKLLIAYANLGVILTILCAILITAGFFISALLTLIVQPEPTAPQNLLLIPGVNEYIPSTFAVWFSILFAMIIHEAGHGILSRVEHIKVKSTGILALVIPIGAFVEPDEEDVEKSPLATKLRMFAAGITNNLFAGAVCIIILVLLLGLVVPGAHPFVYGVYEGYPAQTAGIEPNTIIYSINGIEVTSTADTSAILGGLLPGDEVTISGVYNGEVREYVLTLAGHPDNSGAGFAGISFMNPSAITDTLYVLGHPQSPAGVLSSFLTFAVLPFSSLGGTDIFSFLTADTPDSAILAAPFPGFWEIIHLLFWCAWLNVMLGLTNALPLGICDGGQMLREIVRKIAAKIGMADATARALCSSVTWIIVFALLIMVIMPYLF
ncbi:MAG TPA: site-2 protease family protein [Methanocorpusculum sp.]|nr:site-2 protease family protein [Methanocorpusculum sp.]